MAKRKPVARQNSGPYLAAAFFCETTLTEQDGAVSAIRIVDQITLFIDPAAPSDFPSESQRMPVSIKGLLAFKTGGSPGEHSLRIALESPSGNTRTVLERTLQFPPAPHGGANMHFDNTIWIKQGGLFWFHVFLDGAEVTRMPLQVTVQRGVPGGLTPSAPPSGSPGS